MSTLLFLAAEDVSRWFDELRRQGIRITDGNTGAKLIEEAEELLEAARRLHAEHSLAEAADCYIALLGAVDGAGWTQNQLAHAVMHKMVINRQRRWVLQPDGTYHHVKEQSDGR